jgi:hypothetical protein
MIPTFHILIATAGRLSLKYMINSLRDQLTENDAITIVFDGEGSLERSMFSDEWLKGHKSNITIKKEPVALGHWGHSARNKHQGSLVPSTTFIMNADDDDIYLKGVFNILRTKCQDPDTLYIARFCRDDGTVVPKRNTSNIELCNIGTPCGIIPFAIANSSKWMNIRGGDFHYYNDLKQYTKGIVFLDDTIYKINPVEIDLTH